MELWTIWAQPKRIKNFITWITLPLVVKKCNATPMNNMKLLNLVNTLCFVKKLANAYHVLSV